MKIKVYYIKNFIMSLLITGIMYIAFAYAMIASKQYYALVFIVLTAILVLNRRIVLYEDRIVVYQSYKKIEIKFDSINSIKIDNYSIKFSNVSTPAIYVILKDKNQKIFYYLPYSRESIIEIISNIMEKNKMICLDENIKVLMKNEENKYDIKKRKDDRQTLIIFVLAIIITGMYVFFYK